MVSQELQVPVATTAVLPLLPEKPRTSKPDAYTKYGHFALLFIQGLKRKS
jgi:hypothetical protein